MTDGRKLYSVNCIMEFDMLVVAESEEQAREIAGDNVSEEARNHEFDVGFARETLDYAPHGRAANPTGITTA